MFGAPAPKRRRAFNFFKKWKRKTVPSPIEFGWDVRSPAPERPAASHRRSSQR